MRIVEVARLVAQASEPAAVLELLKLGVRALGVESAVFISFMRDASDLSHCRFSMACDPVWCQHYLAQACPAHDPWLAYAARNSEPVVASTRASDPDQQQVLDLAMAHGFRSAVLAPAHSGPGHSRASVLCLGSSRPGYFDDEGFQLLRLGARMLAAELHDWWAVRLRKELVARTRITPADLELLRFEQQGWSTKRIAWTLQVSQSSINSRFQRLNVKLGVPNRKSAARLVEECGLFFD